MRLVPATASRRSRRRFVGELHGGVAEPPDADHRNQAVSEDALHG